MYAAGVKDPIQWSFVRWRLAPVRLCQWHFLRQWQFKQNTSADTLTVSAKRASGCGFQPAIGCFNHPTGQFEPLESFITVTGAQIMEAAL